MRVEDYVQCQLSENELLRLIAEARNELEMKYVASGSVFSKHAWDEMESLQFVWCKFLLTRI